MCISGRVHPGTQLRYISKTRLHGHRHILCTINILQQAVFSLTALCSVFALQVLIRHLERRHTGLTPISVPSKCERNRVVVCRFIVDGARVDTLRPRCGFKANKGFTGTENNTVEGKDTQTPPGTHSLVIARHCTTVSRRQFSHIPALRITLLSLSLCF